MGKPYDYQLTLRMFLEHGVMHAPNQIIKYRDNFQYTYQDHFNRVKKLSNALKKLGVKPGEAVGILEWDTHRYLEGHWAVPLYGCLFHTVNLRMSPEQIVYCISHAEDVVLFFNEEVLPLLEAVHKSLKTVKTYVLMTDSGVMPETVLPNVIEYEELLNSVSADYEFPEISENSRATLCYTSGTTGNPKGVVFTHRQLSLHAMAVSITMGLYPHSMQVGGWDVYMPLTPMFHVQAWTVPYYAFMLGCKMILPGRYEPDKILKWISEEKVTVSHCVTTILHMLVFHPDVDKYNLKGWKVLLGGAKLNRQLAERARDLGIFTISAYGMTETCPAMTLGNLKHDKYDLPDDKKIDYYIKSGIPWLFSKVRVVDDNFEDVPRDGKTVGQIVVRTPWATHEYFKEPEKTAQLWKNGWLNTGDLGTLDEDGYLMCTDRVKDAIKSGGEWISTLTLEDAISMHPAVLECAVIGVPDEKWDERPAAFVVLKTGQPASTQDIKEHLLKYAREGKIEKWWIPDIIKFVEKIPKNFIGKIHKAALRDMFNKTEN